MRANDLTGLSVVEACCESGLDVPNHVSVLGIDNDELLCGHSRPPLATVEPNFAGAGWLAAKTLQQMIDGRRTEAVLRLDASVTRIVPRDSARPQIGQSALPRLALAHIRNNTATVDVASASRTLGVFPSRLNRAFRKHGRTFAGEIQTARFERALELLKDPRQAISPIASLCGWRSETYLMHLFKRRTGMTMLQWRKRHLASH